MSNEVERLRDENQRIWGLLVYYKTAYNWALKAREAEALKPFDTGVICADCGGRLAYKKPQKVNGFFWEVIPCQCARTQKGQRNE